MKKCNIKRPRKFVSTNGLKKTEVKKNYFLEHPIICMINCYGFKIGLPTILLSIGIETVFFSYLYSVINEL